MTTNPDRILLSDPRAPAPAPRFVPRDQVAVLIKGRYEATTRVVGEVVRVSITLLPNPRNQNSWVQETEYQVIYYPKSDSLRNAVLGRFVTASGANIIALPKEVQHEPSTR